MDPNRNRESELTPTTRHASAKSRYGSSRGLLLIRHIEQAINHTSDFPESVITSIDGINAEHREPENAQRYSSRMTARLIHFRDSVCRR